MVGCSARSEKTRREAYRLFFLYYLPLHKNNCEFVLFYFIFIVFVLLRSISSGLSTHIMHSHIITMLCSMNKLIFSLETTPLDITK